MLWLRPAVMAGKFYPAKKQELLRTIQNFVPEAPKEKVDAFGLMVPHAGYIYSGRIAAEAMAKIQIPQRVILLCPNHTGRGPRISVWSEGAWDTPLGRVPVDEKLGKRLLTALRLKDGDMMAHASEHAIEVELPLLQTFQPQLKIVPIVLGMLSYQECRHLGQILSEIVAEEPKGSILLVASSDMSHYISEKEAFLKDEMALKMLDKMSPKGLYETVLQQEISMCGFIPTTVVLEASLLLGAKSVERFSYTTSAEVTQDTTSVVAYANAIFR